MAAILTPVLGSAAGAVRPLLMEQVRDGTVLGVFSLAVVIGLQTESGPRVVSLLARGATSVPNGVRLTDAGADFPGVRTGGPALVGAGRVRVGGLDISVVRSWRTRVPAICPGDAGVAALAAAAAAAERGVPRGAIGRLEHAVTAAAGSGPRCHELDVAVDGLVGLGRGLTPGGDDMLAGVLMGLQAVGRGDVAASIGDRALHQIAERTTLLSADLLRLAAAGHACLEALAVLKAIHRPGSATPAPVPSGPGARITAAINRLLSIGHTSGADLATGLAIGLHRVCQTRADTVPVLDDARLVPRGRPMAGQGCDREAAMSAARQGAR